MADNKLDAAEEFEDAPEGIIVSKARETPPVPPAVDPAEVADLREKYEGALKDIESLKGTAAVMGRIKELFTGAPESPQDAFVRKELRRLLPEVTGTSAEVAQLKQLLPTLLGALKQEADERLEEKVESATEVLRGLVGEMGLDAKDDDTIAFLEEAVSREIRTNEELLKVWKRGNVKSAVNKAFEKVQSKLFAPVRAKAKRSAVTTIIETPKASTRGSSVPKGGGETKSVDLRDTSRDGIKKVHDA